MLYFITDPSERGRALDLFTIYDHPRDYPESFVVRHWTLCAGILIPGERLAVVPTLADARAAIPSGLENFGRDETDDPAITETWA